MSTAVPQNLEFFIAPDGDDAWSGTSSVPHADRNDGLFDKLGLRTDADRTVLPASVATAEIAP